jgi:hypothetical protein
MLIATFSARNSNHPPPQSKLLIKWFAFGFGLCVGSKLRLHVASFAISSLVSQQIGRDSCYNHILADVPPPMRIHRSNTTLASVMNALGALYAACSCTVTSPQSKDLIGWNAVTCGWEEAARCKVTSFGLFYAFRTEIGRDDKAHNRVCAHSIFSNNLHMW